MILVIVSFIIWKSSEKQSNEEITSNSETDSIVDTNEKGVVGYIVINSNTIYFIHENELPSEKDIKWDEMATFMGHPSDYVLYGDPVEDIFEELQTGDKIEIWYSQVLESYPARLKVEKIKKL